MTTVAMGLEEMEEEPPIELHVGPAGSLSRTGNPKARQFKAMLSVRRPRVSMWTGWSGGRVGLLCVLLPHIPHAHARLTGEGRG